MNSKFAFCATLCCALISLQAKAIDFPSVDSFAASYQNPDAQLQTMVRLALKNTGTQAEIAPDFTAYVKTGDIPAEWLRDSSAQVRPYLLFAKADPSVADFLKAVIQRHAKNLQKDSYANAFREDYTIWEEKYELDSLAYPIMLAWTYWKVTGDKSVFTTDVQMGFLSALNTMEIEQDHADKSKYTNVNLKNNPVGKTGMIWSGFRPSDDACLYNFLIPSEMMAVVALSDMEDVLQSVYNDAADAKRADTLRLAVHNGIQKYGVINTKKYGLVYAYEVDGLGHVNFMDDGNLPNLMSAPYLGYVKVSDPVYVNTRKMILSTDNPYYYTGKFATGIGSPHTPNGMIWPLALLAEGLTAITSAEQQSMLKMLLASDPGDHQLHESFDPNNPLTFTRKDFGWPNALFAEFVLTLFDNVPPLPIGNVSNLKFREAP